MAIQFLLLSKTIFVIVISFFVLVNSFFVVVEEMFCTCKNA